MYKKYIIKIPGGVTIILHFYLKIIDSQGKILCIKCNLSYFSMTLI